VASRRLAIASRLWLTAVFVLQGLAAHREGIPAPKRGRRPIVATLPPFILGKQTEPLNTVKMLKL
jgi:hypothetical protein